MCSDTIQTVSLTNSKYLSANSEPKTNKSLLTQYTKRDKSLEHYSFSEFFRLKYENSSVGQKQIIPHFVGISGHATFPVTERYAQQTLVVHKPWRKYPSSDNWIGEFNNFINLPDAPPAATIPYNRAMHRFYSGTQFVESVAAKPHLSMLGISEETQELLELTGMSYSGELCHDAILIESLDRGANHKWDKTPIVSTKHAFYPSQIFRAPHNFVIAILVP